MERKDNKIGTQKYIIKSLLRPCQEHVIQKLRKRAIRARESHAPKSNKRKMKNCEK